MWTTSHFSLNILHFSNGLICDEVFARSHGLFRLIEQNVSRYVHENCASKDHSNNFKSSISFWVFFWLLVSVQCSLLWFFARIHYFSLSDTFGLMIRMPFHRKPQKTFTPGVLRKCMLCSFALFEKKWTKRLQYQWEKIKVNGNS